MFRGLGDLKDMGAMMKKVMDLKGEMEAVKESLANERVEGQAGAGMVRVVLNGKLELLDIKIEREVINPDEPAVLESLVKAAVNNAVDKAQELVKEKMASVTAGINIPGLM
jgi:DNA-binding YbaB/EbfC family protein